MNQTRMFKKWTKQVKKLIKQGYLKNEPNKDV